jgi:hypothetical protein
MRSVATIAERLPLHRQMQILRSDAATRASNPGALVSCRILLRMTIQDMDDTTDVSLGSSGPSTALGMTNH